MFFILLSAVGLILVLTVVAVYSAFVLAHRTDVLVEKMNSEGRPGNKQAADQT